MTDIEIAKSVELQKIKDIAKKLELKKEDYELYGKYKAKIKTNNFLQKKRKGKLILVTAMSPTKYGEGKTTVSIGLADGLAAMGKNTCLALREPSLGPVFGIKGGATGGGRAQIAPMEDINLHFTGDFHAIGAANNLLCAMVDNHIFHGNALGITKVEIKRCMDMNDRQLRNIIDGIGDKCGVERTDGFDITVATEVMACFCLATGLKNLETRLGNITVGYNAEGKRIYAKDLKAEGAMTALLKEAFKPNLVQTLEGTPAIVHGGPFANIAHGCNSVVATDLALKLADYVVTEAGFGADLGAEKFMDIKCRKLAKMPDVVVLVVTCRAAEHTGYENILKHYENLIHYGNKVIAVVNKFSSDEEKSIAKLKKFLKSNNIENYVVNSWAEGGVGSMEAAAAIVEACALPAENKHHLYHRHDTTLNKLAALCDYYGAGSLKLLPEAQEKLAEMDKYPVPICVAKTQYSFSDNPELLGAPTGFEFTIRDFKYCSGAEFIVAYAGKILTMPGLPRIPAAEAIGVDDNGEIYGIF